MRLSGIIFNSPFEYDVIYTFVRAHEELVYFICSQTRSPRLWDGNCGISRNTFVLIVPIATEKVSRITIRSNIIWNRWKSILRARSICTLLIRPGEILESVARPSAAGLR